MSKKQKEWLDISNEKYREYVQPHQFGAATMRITDPVSLSIGEEGHTIKDKKGVTHEIPRGWLKITFEDRKYAAESAEEEPKEVVEEDRPAKLNDK